MAKVIFDPGHGGRDPGSIWFDDLREKDVVLPLSFLIAGSLQWLSKGKIEIDFTRKHDEYLTLARRVEIEHEADANLFVSVHCNSFTSSTPRGFEVHYYSNMSRGKRVAEDIVNAVHSMYPLHGNGLKVSPRFHVIKNTHAPAVLLESLYVSNRVDRQLLKDRDSRSTLAWLIARGLWYSRDVWSG